LSNDIPVTGTLVVVTAIVTVVQSYEYTQVTVQVHVATAVITHLLSTVAILLLELVHLII
jgi:hypothetical protein